MHQHQGSFLLAEATLEATAPPEANVTPPEGQVAEPTPEDEGEALLQEIEGKAPPTETDAERTAGEGKEERDPDIEELVKAEAEVAAEKARQEAREEARKEQERKDRETQQAQRINLTRQALQLRHQQIDQAAQQFGWDEEQTQAVRALVNSHHRDVAPQTAIAYWDSLFEYAPRSLGEQAKGFVEKRGEFRDYADALADFESRVRKDEASKHVSKAEARRQAALAAVKAKQLIEKKLRDNPDLTLSQVRGVENHSGSGAPRFTNPTDNDVAFNEGRITAAQWKANADRLRGARS